MKKVGLLGGTFDPVHNGHISIADSFIKSGFIDELWIILTPYPPHKLEENRVSYSQRLEMLKLAFDGKTNISISTIENELPKPSYTVHTIRYLKKNYPDSEFCFCLGEDSLLNFHSWKFYDKILEEAKLLVAVRPGYDHSIVQDAILEQSIFVQHQPLNISSTNIKEMVKEGKEIIDLVPQKVLSYIKEHKLYS